ncbi:hypothetical protein [Actinomadura sp. NTSP31]|uniref:hypothetical protein n=1 Tax=Actinomadura sp. NTSP31 TaxID=1735447 RepID=UPI0035C0DA7D
MTSPLSDDFPVLLGPVRIETRFTATELLVRVFPDEWAVDKFEPRPTRAEIAALDAYWTARWTAAGDPAGVQEAFRELAARVPAGRATWLLRTRTPADPAEEPSGLAPGTTVLVVVSAQAPAIADRAPSVAYWTAVWRAHGDRQALRAADAALLTAVGAARAAAIRAARPAGVDAAAVAAGDAVAVAFLVLPPVTDVAADSWTQAARARLLPDRFTVLGYVDGTQVLSATGAQVPATLPVSPDPGAGDQLSVDERTGQLHVPDELRWLTDFDRAVQIGMGLRIPLDDSTRGGLDRLVVLGLRTRTGPAQGAADLADLITRQVCSPAGFALLPQGTPTNNSEDAPAGQDERAEADASLATAGGLDAHTDWTTETDGHRLVGLLGLDPAVLDGMPNADLTDQRDARAANTALWPATWGYFLRTALHPILGAGAIDETRDFFLRYVSGRGPLPAVKIGRQPYGIVPTTAFSRLAWPDSRPHRRALNTVLSAAAQDWAAVAEKVPHIGADADDTHQLLLDILAQHPTSAEFYQRYAQSVEDVFNRENLGGLGATVLPALDRLGMPGPLRALLTRLGHPDGGEAQDPDLLRRLFVDFQQPLLAPLVDDRPLSETDPVRDYTPDHRNYLRLLADNAGADLDAVRLDLGFTGDTPPAALLYLMLRHAVLLGWADAARNLAVAAGVADPGELAADPAFIHVRIPGAGRSLPSESRFRRLYTPEPAVTGSADRLLVDFIPGVLHQSPATAQLAEQVAAIGTLAGLPTAALERVLTEHLDLATYRLDAWRLGLATERLGELRFGPDGTAPAATGLHLGAYGWLEDVRPRTDELTPVQLTGPLAEVFKGPAPLLQDPANEGFVHAPSPGHARTAAVLRAGYAAGASPQTPDAFAVDLGSARVRTALGLLDGLRQGQPLGALLGYRLERGLHDRHGRAEVDAFVAALRLAFPLRAGKIPDTVPDPARPVRIDQVEARNVVDGLALVRHVTRGDVEQRYPFGLEGTLPDATTDQADAITAEVLALIQVNDALADLAVAEGAHQALAGNAERASATLDAYAKEGFPPEPDVVRTPRSGTTLTHRFALRLTPGLNPDHGPGISSARSQAEPAVNDWLPGLLPDKTDVAALVTWTDPVGGKQERRVVSQNDIGLQPIDLLWTVRPVARASTTELDDLIIGEVLDREHPRPDAELTIHYTERIDGKVGFFELSPLIAALRSLLTASRPLRPTDLMAASGVTTVDRGIDDAVSVDRDRPAAVIDTLTDLGDDVAEFIADLGKLYPAPPAAVRRSDVLDQIDAFLTRYAGLAGVAARFGLTTAGWSELAAWRRGVFTGVLAQVADAAARLTRALSAADAVLAGYDALKSGTLDSERYRILRQAERLLTTHPVATPPNTPAKYRTAVGNLRKTFNGRVEKLDQIAGSSRDTLSGLLHDVAGLLPITDIDPEGLDLAPTQDQVVAYGRTLLDRAKAAQAEIAARLAAASAAMARHDQAVTGPDRVTAATDALRALLGADVLVVPEYTPPDALAAEVRKARDGSADLVAHLTRPPVARDFPLDDWLHGVARVRDKPRLWEQTLLLAGALAGDEGVLDDEPELVPIQLPWRADDHWLGMEFVPGTAITEDRLLFTASYTTQNSPGQDRTQVGLLIDEWTEVVPADRETTGIAVNVDRPDSEPPQAMLLVAPPVRTGAWDVGDLVAAVNETFDLARSRAVEPEHLDDTPYAQLLPATVMSATRQPITISTDLAVANARWKAAHD